MNETLSEAWRERFAQRIGYCMATSKTPAETVEQLEYLLEIFADDAAVRHFDEAVRETMMWAGPWGYPGVSEFVARRDAYIRDRLDGAEP